MDILKESTRTNVTKQNLHIQKPNKGVHMKENHVVIECMEVGSDEDCLEEEHTTDLASEQELTARTINPMKLIMLLRTRFGIGRYEISVRPRRGQFKKGTRTDCSQRMRNVYNIRTPRRLSVEEIAGCRWD
jgi:hypothetical protein